MIIVFPSKEVVGKAGGNHYNINFVILLSMGGNSNWCIPSALAV
jgi:hypothetical protein